MRREWWLSNCAGGWASSTVSGANTRKYHGLLCAAYPNVESKYILLSKFEDFAVVGGRSIALSTNYYPDAIHPKGYENIEDFSFDGAVARWTYEILGRRISKEIWCARGRNMTFARYTLLSGAGIGIEAIPLICGRGAHSIGADLRIENSMREGAREIYFEFPFSWKICANKGMFLPKRELYYNMTYPQEIEREEISSENLFAPGKFSAYLSEGQNLTFCCGQGENSGPEPEVASRREEFLVHRFMEARKLEGVGKLATLVRAADSFVITGPKNTIIAGYPYFGEWGRDTMISLPGLLFYTARGEISHKILGEWIEYIKDGLMPNKFGESGDAIYESADASLWFSWALSELENAQILRDDQLEKYCGALEKIAKGYSMGNEFVKMDVDGLLSLRGDRLTWMDAQVDGQAVTPRSGKRIEINALWCNLLFKLVDWGEKINLDVEEYRAIYLKAKKSMNKFYWEKGGYLLDGIEPADYSLRPNQLWALALERAGINGEIAKKSLATVREELWVEGYGLRTLAKDDEKYIGEYRGSMRNRDLAYHRGTIWPWLCGAYAQAIARIEPQLVENTIFEFEELLSPQNGALVSLCEVYDPKSLEPGGCPAQAWSVGETIRGYLTLILQREKHRDLKLLEAREKAGGQWDGK